VKHAVALVLLLLWASAGCSGTNGPLRLDVAAAADLARALPALAPQLEQNCGVKLVITFGSSGQLAQQIEAGAPFAVFFSAQERYVDPLVKAGRTVPDGVRLYALGRLAIVTREGLPPVRSLAELAQRDDLRRISIANPAHAPYGEAALQALESAGVVEAVRPRLVYGENVRQAYEYVERGDADAGIVAAPLLERLDDAVLVPSELHQPIRQTAAVLRGEHEDAGRCVVHEVLTPAGQALLQSFGFEPVSP